MIMIPILIFIAFVAIIISNSRDAKKSKVEFESKPDQTRHNPATGLPMIGSLDSMGNSIGTSASDRASYSNNDYHRPSYTSSYDPFSNRY